MSRKRAETFEVPAGPWRTDFDAPDIHDAPIIVFATDDDGFAFGFGAWHHETAGQPPILVWGHDPYLPINDGIEHALCWRHFGYPGVQRLTEITSSIRKGEPK
jgi:hypothetical protein